MKKHFFILFVLFATSSIAQPVRLHIMAGFANYNGDIQQKRFTLESAKAAIGAGATFSITDRFSIRGDAYYAHVGANDKNNNKLQLRARNLNFETRIYEMSLLGEYDFVSLYQHKFSPYVFGGIGLFHFSPYTYDAKGAKVYLSGLSTEGEGIVSGRKAYKRTQANIPLGGGIKYALSDDIHIGFELGLRVLATDYLDDVSKTFIDRNILLAARGQQAVDLAFRGDELKPNTQQYPKAGAIRGNSKVKDFYYFGLFRIDFLLNWFDKGGGRGRGLRCPQKL